jgi:hypothetical protein
VSTLFDEVGWWHDNDVGHLYGGLATRGRWRHALHLLQHHSASPSAPGTLCFKDGKWATQYTVYTAEGRKRKTLYGKTRQEVAANLTKAMADRDGWLLFDAGSLTLGQYLDTRLVASVKDTVRLTTYQGYERTCRLHIKPSLGRVRLKDLAVVHVRGL